MKAILDVLLGLIGLGKSAIDDKRERRALENSPEIKSRETARIESELNDETKGVVARAANGDKKALGDIRREVGE